MPAATRWRVRIDSVQNTSRKCIVAGDIDFYTVRGGAGQVPVQTGYSASLLYHNDGFDAAWKAFDSSNSTIWHDSCAFGNGFIGWDFGSSIDIVGFSWFTRDGGYGDEDSIATGGLEYWDGSAWQTLFNIPTQSGWPDSTPFYFYDPAQASPDSGGKRFWEIEVAANPSGQSLVGWSGIELARADGVNICTIPHGIAPSVNTTLQGGSVRTILATDGSTGLVQWDSTSSPKRIVIDFGTNALRKIRYVKMYPNKDGLLRTPLNFNVIAYDNPDRSDATLIKNFTTASWTELTPQTFDIDAAVLAPTAGSLSASATLSGIDVVVRGVAGTLTASATLSGAGAVLDPSVFTVGTLSASATLLARQASLGTIQSIAQFYASPDMLARADPTRATTGAFSAGASMIGRSFALGTIRGAGAFAASATFGTDGFATGLISTVGAITGNATLTGNGSAVRGSVGGLTATAVLSGGGGYAPTLVVGMLTATVTLTAQPRAVYGMVGLATASARFESIANRVAQVAGSFSATGAMLGQVFNGQPRAPGLAATATFSAAGRGINSSVGSATASATATAFSILFRGGRGALSGAATLAGTQTAVLVPVGGTGAAAAFAAVGASIWATRGIFIAAANASALGTGLKPAVGAFSAAAALSAPARSTASTKADLQASAAFAPIGQRVGFFSPADRVIAVAAESRKVTVEQGSKLFDRTLVIAPRDKVVVIASGDRTVRAA